MQHFFNKNVFYIQVQKTKKLLSVNAIYVKMETFLLKSGRWFGSYLLPFSLPLLYHSYPILFFSICLCLYLYTTTTTTTATTVRPCICLECSVYKLYSTFNVTTLLSLNVETKLKTCDALQGMKWKYQMMYRHQFLLKIHINGTLFLFIRQ